MTTKTIYISLLGIDQRSRSAYEIFFKQIHNMDYVLTDDLSQAQICLVDMDAYNIEERYQTLLSKHPTMIILVLSLSTYKCRLDTEFFIRKPVKRTSLAQSLHQIFSRFFQIPVLSSMQEQPEPHPVPADYKVVTRKTTAEVKLQTPAASSEKKSAAKEVKKAKVIPIKENMPASAANAGKLLKVENEEYFVGEQADIDVDDPQQLKTVFYSPVNCLQAVVEQASKQSRQSGQIIQVNIHNHEFYFDYAEQIVYSTVGPGIIRPLCLLSLDNKPRFTSRPNSFRNELHKIIHSNKNKTMKKSLEKQNWSMESFMWLISLWSSRGRIPVGTEILKPVFLMEWPNLTRLASVPHALRIAALLYDHPYPLADAARLLGIEQRYVFAFYSACKAIGLANVSRRQIDHTFAPEPGAEPENKSILSKLLGRLKRFSEKSSINDIA